MEETIPDPTTDVDGFMPWMHINVNFEGNIHRLTGTSALLAAAKVDFKIISKDSEWTAIHVRKCNTKALEILWNLSKLVDVKAPVILKIVIPDQMEQVETIPGVELEPNRFDEI